MQFGIRKLATIHACTKTQCDAVLMLFNRRVFLVSVVIVVVVVVGGFLHSNGKSQTMKSEGKRCRKTTFLANIFGQNRNKQNDWNVLFVTFETVHGIINSNLSLSLSNFCSEITLFFQPYLFRHIFIPYQCFCWCVCCFSFFRSVFHRASFRCSWCVLKSNLVACAYKLRSAPLFMHPHQAIFQFHATLCFSYCFALLHFAAAAAATVGIITEYR